MFFNVYEWTVKIDGRLSLAYVLASSFIEHTFGKDGSVYIHFSNISKFETFQVFLQKIKVEKTFLGNILIGYAFYRKFAT